MARPRKEIDWRDVEKLAAMQCTQEEVAAFCECAVDTLERACVRDKEMPFSEFYAQHKGTGKISLRRMQWACAQKGNVTMLIWLGKNMLGQKDGRDETDVSNHTEVAPIGSFEYAKLKEQREKKNG